MPLLVCQAARCSVYRAYSTLRPSLSLSTPASVLSFYRSQGCLNSHTFRPPGLVNGASHSRFGALVTAARAKDDLLRGVDPEYREDIARILDLADQAQATWTTVFTGVFVSRVPRHQANGCLGLCSAFASLCRSSLKFHQQRGTDQIILTLKDYRCDQFSEASAKL